MSKKVLTNLDMQYNQLINAELGNSAGNPSTLVESLVWYDTVTHKPMYYDGTSACEFGRIYNDFTGANGISGGAHGLVPAPSASDNVKFLKGDGTWGVPAGTTYSEGTGIDITNSVISIDETVVATKTDLANYQLEINDVNKLSADLIYSGRTNVVVTKTEKTAWNAKQDAIDSSHKLSADLVDDTTSTNKFATAAQLSQIATNQSNISTINGKIPSEASSTNQLADKAFVNSTVQTNTANFRGSWATWSAVPSNATEYPADGTGSKTPTVNDYIVVQDASGYTGETLTGTWRFKYTGVWSTNGKNGWEPEYQVNETPLTAAQLATLNSGITAGNKVIHTANAQIGSETKGVYIAANGTATAMTYSVKKDVPSNAVFTDTTYIFGTGSTNGTISVTPSGGSASNVSVKGLGSAAYTASTDYATSAQGGKADTAVQKYSTTNPALTQSGGLCTWTVTHSLGTKNVQVTVYETSSGEEVIVDSVRTSTSVVTVKINSTSNISASTYTVVVQGR